MSYMTDQEEFWAGDFGDNYIKRNQGEKLLASNINFFTKSLNNAKSVKSVIEFGANIGMNIKALKMIYPHTEFMGVEINKNAYEKLKEVVGLDNAFNCSINNFNIKQKSDLVLIKGVLIHINPKLLKIVYDKLYQSSKKYILIAEYYNPTPVNINYRGFNDRLFKRDFAGEFLDQFPNTSLLDYGFSYHRDTDFPQDDITWFLIEKN